MSFASTGIRTLIVRILVSLLSILGGVINARWLGPHGVGLYTLFILLSTLCLMVFNFGFGSSLAYFTARKKENQRMMLALTWKTATVLSAAGMAGAYFFWRLPISPWRDFEATYFYLCLPTIPLFFFYNFLQRTMSGLLKIREVNHGEIITALSYLFVLPITVVVLDWGIYGAGIAYLTSLVSVVAYYAYLLHKFTAASERSKRSQTALLREFWQYGRWNYLVLLNNFLYSRLPVFFIKYFYPNNILGLFSVAQNVSAKIKMVPDSFSQVLFPFAAAATPQEAARRTNALCRNFMLLTTLVVLVMYFLSNWAIVFIYGIEFQSSVQIFHALLPGIWFYPFSKFFYIHLAAAGRSRTSFIITGFGTFVTVGSCLTLIPAYGGLGAALGISLSNACAFALGLTLYRRMTGARLRELFLPQKSDLAYLVSSLPSFGRKLGLSIRRGEAGA